MINYKYPRTYHLPWSPGKGDDDKVQNDLSNFKDKRIIITEKMDGENTTIYSDGRCHARSIDSSNHPSRSWVKALAAEIPSRINFPKSPNDEIRFCGENLYATHSIHYQNLESYFLLFNIWANQLCYDWDTTELIAQKMKLSIVPIIYDGIFDDLLIRALPSSLKEDQEGFVIRLATDIHLKDWNKSVVKWVRKNHVQTDEHWINQKIIKNELGHEHI